MTSTAAYQQEAVEIIGLNLCGLTDIYRHTYIFGHNNHLGVQTYTASGRS